MTDAPHPAALTLSGYDNYGRPRQDYVNSLAKLNEKEFLYAAEQAIWLSAYASNNPRSDYHWQCDACYAEAVRRGDETLYSRAHEKVSAQ